MGALEYAPIQLVDISLLNLREWVRLTCQKRAQPTFEGIYTAGGCVVGQIYVPDVYYRKMHGVEVLVILDSDHKAFFILHEDVVHIQVLHTSVKDD